MISRESATPSIPGPGDDEHQKVQECWTRLSTEAVALGFTSSLGQVLPFTTMVSKKASGFQTGEMSEVAPGRKGMFKSGSFPYS